MSRKIPTRLHLDGRNDVWRICADGNMSSVIEPSSELLDGKYKISLIFLDLRMLGIR